MKRIIFSSKAKKDLKKIQYDTNKRNALEHVLAVLANGETLGKEYKPHQLKGDYKGCMECHIKDDYLLIWIDDDCIRVIRVGSHSELF